jgi:hypothetical protein
MNCYCQLPNSVLFIHGKVIMTNLEIPFFFVGLLKGEILS